MRLTQIITRAAQVNPIGMATRFEGREHSWTQFVERVRLLAGGLLAQGLTPGDRVAMLALNGDRFLESIFAIFWAGGILQPINLRLAGAEIVDQLEDSGARFVILDQTGRQLIAGVRDRLGTVERHVFIGDEAPAPDEAGYDALMGLGRSPEASERGGGDFAVLFYTGGTTGRAKGVMLSHRNLVTGALCQSAMAPMDKTDVSLHALPMFHVGAITGMLVGAVGAGGHCFLTGFEPVKWMQAVEADRITRTAAAPTMIRMMLEHPRFGEFDLSSLRRLHYGTAPMPEALLEETIRKLPNTGLLQGYGQTESGGVVSLLLQRYHTLSGPHAGKLRSAGQCVPGVEMGVVDAQGNALPTGQVGEIRVRGDSIMGGYWNRPAETAAALVDGWLHTGDAGYLDEDGFVFIVDRVKDMVVTGGENVFSAEVEGALYRHPAVAECAVIGIPHTQWGEQVHAIVRLKDGAGATEAELIAHATTLIARYKCPKSVSFRAEALPLSAIGKILKSELRKPFWAGQTRNVN